MFLATRALVRTALSSYVDVEPQAWRFAEGTHGKPYVTEPLGPQRLHFNLTNTPGLVVCAVSRAFDQVGVDAEWLGRATEPMGLADSHFSPIEVQALRAVPPGLRRGVFFRYWTLKESYIKARGLGLALPLDQFSFLLHKGAPIRIAFASTLHDDPDHWRFALFSASSSHLVAVGVDTAGAALELSASHFVPLRGFRPFGENSQ
jgi:4'-phosphopantetheinyl transferase